MQLVSGLTTNGAVLQCLAVARALDARGHEVTLVCRPGAWIAEQVAGTGIRVVANQLRRWPLSDLKDLAGIVRQTRVQVLHTHQSRAHLSGVLLKWLTGVPCVATAHARHVQPHWFFNDFVIANSQATFDFQRRWNLISPRRMRVVHYLLDLGKYSQLSPEGRDQIRQEWRLTPANLAVGVIGDIIPRKAQLDLVHAWPFVLKQQPTAQLLMIGAEKDAAYAACVREAIGRMGLDSRISILGYRTDIPAVMSGLDLCVSAAREEALGLTIPEAMAARLAVVATNVGGVPENVWPGETGLLVPKADPHAMAAAICELLAEPDRRREWGENGRRRVLEKYNFQLQMEELEQIYAGLIPGA